MTIFLIILAYLSGFVATYILVKNTILETIGEEDNGWQEVTMRGTLSMFSWFMFFFIGTIWLIVLIVEKIKLPRPPKWL